RLSAEFLSVQGRLSLAEETLDALAEGREAGQRVRALLPAQIAKLEGRLSSWLEVLRRNVALHANAEGIDVSTACASVLRREQRGLRLEARLGVTQRGLRAAVAEFVPGAGRWEAMPEAPPQGAGLHLSLSACGASAAPSFSPARIWDGRSLLLGIPLVIIPPLGSLDDEVLSVPWAPGVLEPFRQTSEEPDHNQLVKKYRNHPKVKQACAKAREVPLENGADTGVWHDESSYIRERLDELKQWN
ncbi:unnamed protein product, partial [Prorocentrum cordatum]